MKDIKVSFRGRDIYVKEGTTYKEVGDLLKREFDFDILACCANNSFVDLDDEIKQECIVDYYDRSSIVGNRVYSSSCNFILFVAIKHVLGNDAKLICQHSQDKGVYCTIENAFINEDVIKNIENEMHSIVNADLMFEKMTVSRMDAIKYFKQMGQDDKANVLKYISNTYINLYKLDNIIDYYYSRMAYSTKAINKFTLNYIGGNGFVMQLPDLANPEVVLDYYHYSKIFDKFQEYNDWGTDLGITSAADLNQFVSAGYSDDLILLTEANFNRQLDKVAQNIIESGSRIVLVAGPSSSGKTTTAKKIGLYLKCLGYNPYAISTDDYFVNMEDTPKDQFGNYDFECLEAVDIELFNRQMNSLLNGESVILPKYNFKTGKREYRDKALTLGKKGVVIIEGIHALNDKLSMAIDNNDKYRIYLGPLTQINIDNHTYVHTSDVRKLRRIVRDNKTRNKGALATMKLWSNVRRGETNNIFPYQDNVDEVVNSSLIYEIGVLKTYVEPLLYNVPEDSEEYGEALRLINFLRNFLAIPSDTIPADSVLREFIGGSCIE